MNDLKLKFGKRVRELRKSKGLSQERFAALADIDRTYIADIENGRRNVSLIIINKISNALQLSMSEVLANL